MPFLGAMSLTSQYMPLLWCVHSHSGCSDHFKHILLLDSSDKLCHWKGFCCTKFIVYLNYLPAIKKWENYYSIQTSVGAFSAVHIALERMVQQSVILI